MSTPARSVQFRNSNDVLTAFESRNVPDFSVWQGKQFMFKYEGGDLGEGAQTLSDILNILQQSAAIYTLKVYEDLPTGGKIKSNTPDDGSFNFRLTEETPGMNNYNNQGLVSEINALKMQIKELMEEEEDEPVNNSLGMVGDILQHPVVQQFLPDIIAAIKGTPAVPAKIAGIPAGDQSQKMQEAIFILQAADPLIGDHLYKLATIAKDNPKYFQMLLQMLESA